MISFPYTSVKTLEDGAVKYDRAIDSKVKRLYNKLRYKQGVTVDVGGGFQVVADTGMNVKVKCGGAWGHVGGNFCYEEAESRVLAVQAPDTTYDRIDLVVLRNDITQEKRAVDLYVVEGTPASSPKKPALTNTPEIQEICLATLFITKNVNSISQDRISDTRLDQEVCGILTNAFGNIDASAFFTQMNALIKELQEAIIAVEGDTAWMMQSLYDPQGKRTDIFKTIEDARQKGVFLYKATFSSSKWGSSSPYTQTVTVTPVNGGPNVTANSQICSGFGIRDDFGTDVTYHRQRLIAADLNRSKSKKFGNGTLTLTTNNKPLADIELYFLAQDKDENGFGLTFPGGGSEIVLLWENNTPGLWSGRKVSLDLSAYDAVLIVVKLQSGYTQATTHICYKGFVASLIVADSSGTQSLYSIRKAGIQSDGIQFGEAYDYGTSNVNNQYNWPYRIYGIKF